MRSELFVEADGKLSFSHDLNREAVRGGLPISAVHALDRQAAAALLAAGALPVEVAKQLAAGAEPGDELAITTLTKAAQSLGTTDPSQAADLSRRALNLTSPRHALRGLLVASTAIFLHAAQRAEEAKTFADTALRQTLPAEQEAEVRHSIASMFSLSPDVRADNCRQALALPGLSAGLRGRLIAQLFHNLVVANRPEDAAAMLDDAREAVERTGDPAGRFTLQLAESFLEYITGRHQAALALVNQLLRTSPEAAQDGRTRQAPILRCEILAVCDRIDEAFDEAAEGINATQRDRQGGALHIFEAWRGRQLFQIGRLADAAAALEGRFSPNDAEVVVSAPDAASVVALGRVALHTGDRPQTRLCARIARGLLDCPVPGVRGQAAWLLSLLAMAAGDPHLAHRWLASGTGDGRASPFPLFPIDPTDDVHLVRIALGAGNEALAEQAAADVEGRRELSSDAPSIVATALHARGLLEHDRQLVTDAIRVLEGTKRRLALASALEDLGVLSASTGAEEAVAALDRALVIYTDCGASWDAGRVRRRLRRLGVRRRLVQTSRPVSGWAAMTDSELEVVRLVADGLTNREVAQRLFVSPHTVSGHLRHTFEKLAINSRVELARLAAEHEQHRANITIQTT